MKKKHEKNEKKIKGLTKNLPPSQWGEAANIPNVTLSSHTLNNETL